MRVGKRKIRDPIYSNNGWRGRNVCISWSESDEALFRYCLAKWKMPFTEKYNDVGKRNEVGRSMLIHASISLTALFLDWSEETGKKIPTEFFEYLYGKDFKERKSHIKYLYAGVIREKAKRSTYKPKFRSRTPQADETTPGEKRLSG